MTGRESGFEDYLGFLQTLHEGKVAHFLEGGQAVNFWAEYVVAKAGSESLSALRPFTSKDCDVWVSHPALKRIEAEAGKSLVKGTSPADGQIGILTLSKDPPRVVDLMSSVYGIPQKEYSKLCERALVFEGITVIDPLNLFRSKCHCLLHLDQTDRQDERHVRMLSLILPVFLSGLIDEAVSGEVPERAVLSEIKLLAKIVKSGPCRRALTQCGINGNEMIPWDKMENCGSEILARFVQGSRGKDGVR